MNQTTKADSCFVPGLVSVHEARSFLLARARPVTEVEHIDTGQSLGRVLARSQHSTIDVPGYDNSAMDGYAVHSGTISPDGETRLPVAQRIAAGQTGMPLGEGQAARIFTGAPIPQGADAVVMQEHCTENGETVRIRGPVTPGMNLRPRGNDISAGAEVLAAGTRMRPQEMGLAASVGLAELPVYRRLRVAILSSGDELIPPGEALGEGKIYNSNRYSLLGLLAGLGCQVLDLGTVADDYAATQVVLQEAAREADLIVTSGGVSVGEEDHIKRAVENIGRVDLWRIAVKPGKPLAYGRIDDADFLGLPGNPVSALVTFCLFVRPFTLRRQGATEVLPRPLPVRAGFDWPRPKDRREYARARLEPDGAGGFSATLFPKQGSDVLTSAVWAHGLVEVQEGVAVTRGDIVSYLPFAELLG